MNNYNFQPLLQTAAGVFCQVIKANWITQFSSVKCTEQTSKCLVGSPMRMCQFYRINPIFHIFVFFAIAFAIVSDAAESLSTGMCSKHCYNQRQCTSLAVCQSIWCSFLVVKYGVYVICCTQPRPFVQINLLSVKCMNLKIF